MMDVHILVLSPINPDCGQFSPVVRFVEVVGGEYSRRLLPGAPDVAGELAATQDGYPRRACTPPVV